VVESQPSKLLVAGSIPVSRSRFPKAGSRINMAQPQQTGTPPSNLDRSIALFERPAMTIADQATFTSVKQAIETCFSGPGIEKFFKGLDRAGIRVRNFEAVLNAGHLGAGTPAEYASLSNGDQGQIREFYLATIEHVDLALRDRFFKLYAYY
jgi:hypothetical protein